MLTRLGRMNTTCSVLLHSEADHISGIPRKASLLTSATTSLRSFLSTNATALPLLPILPSRPIRWIKSIVVCGMPCKMTKRVLIVSRPREPRSVVTKTLTLGRCLVGLLADVVESAMNIA